MAAGADRRVERVSTRHARVRHIVGQTLFSTPSLVDMQAKTQAFLASRRLVFAGKRPRNPMPDDFHPLMATIAIVKLTSSSSLKCLAPTVDLVRRVRLDDHC